MSFTSFAGVVKNDGTIAFNEKVELPPGTRVLVTVLADAVPALAGEPADTRAAGRRWQDLFEPVRRLGAGGMGATYLARDLATGRLVCIKHLREKVDPRALQQECRALARLDHPAIVRLLNFDADAPEPYLVTEYLDGPTLSAYSRDRALVEPVVLQLAAGLFAALAYAHEHDVLHRDLKPQNILLAHDGRALRPKILDFGLAVVDRRDRNDVITAAGVVEGTMPYMAPEQLAGEELTPACDVYSLGQVLWELLSGCRAFGGAPWQVVNEKCHASHGLVLGPAVAESVSPELAALIEQATRPVPADRPSARDALTRVEALIRVNAPAVVGPSNLTFEWQEEDGSPSGWFNGLGYVGSVSTDYASSCSGSGAPRHAVIAGARARPDQFGTLMQRIPAGPLAGCVVRFTADLSVAAAPNGAALWVRVDGANGKCLAFDNMGDRRIRGTTDWRACEIRVRVPAGAEWLNYGVLLAGPGTARLARPQLLREANDGTWQSLALWRSPDAHGGETEDMLT